MSDHLTAEPIAQVVADLRAGRVSHPDSLGKPLAAEHLQDVKRPQPVVDCTAIFHMQQQATMIDLYDDYPSIVPPWDDCLLCYVNTFGNVIAMQVRRYEWDGTPPKKEHWYTDNVVDWDAVRWVATTTIWVGGQDGTGRLLPTTGPCHMFRHAIKADGSPEDINWVALMAKRGQSGRHDQIEDDNRKLWEASLVTLGASLNFMNASNVDVAEPARPRQLRRRIARTGTTVQTIVIRPPGKHRVKSGVARPIDASETPLTSVRGHWARYGEQYGRGLLFGKYAGKFWVPAYARGVGEAEEKTYVLKPATERAAS